MKDKKRNRQAIIVALLVIGIFSITLGVTYAFFNGGVNVVSNQTVASEAGTMKLVMNDGNTGWSEVWDFGESKTKTFTKIYLPLTISGAFNGSLMVFIPAIGYFFITDILGGGKIMIIGIDLGTSAVKLLLKNDLIIQENGVYRVYDYFFAEWLANVY